jgi:SepF-like predicted cell division protein (DUF552 family)
MNGKQIENLLQMVDGNVHIAQTEALQYIRDNQSEIIRELAMTGVATVKTAAGNVQLRVEDLEAAAA